jgi:hypothetical protein
VSIEPSWKTDNDQRCLHARNPLSFKLLHASKQKGGVLIGKSPVVSQASNHVVSTLEEGGFPYKKGSTVHIHGIGQGAFGLTIVSDPDSWGKGRWESDLGAFEISESCDDFDGTAANVDPDASAFELHMFFQSGV